MTSISIDLSCATLFMAMLGEHIASHGCANSINQDTLFADRTKIVNVPGPRGDGRALRNKKREGVRVAIMGNIAVRAFEVQCQPR
jgi:hypothetical protein